MKKDIHPENYREVIFADNTSGEEFLLWSTVETNENGTFNGKEYPLYRIEISSASHPFYTGVKTTIDTAGRVEKFKARQKAAKGQS
jgi:large subunit ribosomal protein L31